MNEINDWFPEGEEPWGSSVCPERILTPEERQKENESYERKFNIKYKEWLALPENERQINLAFFRRAFEEGKNITPDSQKLK
jgi:hypothetical protein